MNNLLVVTGTSAIVTSESNTVCKINILEGTKRAINAVEVLNSCTCYAFGYFCSSASYVALNIYLMSVFSSTHFRGASCD